MGANLLDQALVDAHLVHVPGLGTLTVGRLARSDLQVLGRKADGALDAEVLFCHRIVSFFKSHLPFQMTVAR